MEAAGAERHRRSPVGELSGESESIEPARGTKATLSTKSESVVKAGAGIEPANRFTAGEAIHLLRYTRQVTTSLTLANVVTLL
jgi:hypothetical protein